MTHEQKKEFSQLVIKVFELELGEKAPPEPIASMLVNDAIKDFATEVGGISVEKCDILIANLNKEIVKLSNPFHKELEALKVLEKSMKMLGYSDTYEYLLTKFQLRP